MNKRELLIKRVLPLLVLGAAGAVAYWLIATEPKPERAPEEDQSLLVETMVVRKSFERPVITAQGTVVPAQRVNVQPQVSGIVQSVDAQLKPGGLLSKGDTMLTIDPADFRLALEQRQTELLEARAQLALEQGRQDVAQDEWALFKKEFGDEGDVDTEPPALALRQPQLASAEAALARAQAAVQQARLQLQRTRISAPFDALVIAESVDQGQLVQPQQSIAELVGANQFWVRVALAPEQIAFIDIPSGAEQTGAPAEVLFDIGGQTMRFDGHVARLEGQLDPQSRMAQLIVAIPDPLSAFRQAPRSDRTAAFPLLLNAYVDVIIETQQPIEVFIVPRTAVHNGNQVYLYNNGKLQIRQLDIAWEREDAVLARGPLQEGQRLITSNIGTPVEGMPLRLADPQQGSP